MHLTWAVDVRGPTDSENAAYTYIDPALGVGAVVTVGESVHSNNPLKRSNNPLKRSNNPLKMKVALI